MVYSFTFILGITMKKFILAISCALFFTGCTVRPPSIELPSVEIDSPIKIHDEDNDHNHDGGQRFCPPGQAKKGNC